MLQFNCIIYIFTSKRLVLLLVIRYQGFPGSASGKESTCHCRRHQEMQVQLLSQEDPPGGGHGNSLQYSCLENSHGQTNLAGDSPQGHKESDMTEATQHAHVNHQHLELENFQILYLAFLQSHLGEMTNHLKRKMMKSRRKIM